MNVNTLALFHKALSEPSRLKILKDLLDNGERCVCAFNTVIKKDASVVSRHIKLLEQANIVKTRKEGTCVYCTLNNKNQIKQILEG